MTGDNQQHMTITSDTKNAIVTNWFIPDLTDASRPSIRKGSSINQTASKPVAYVVQNTIQFGGNNNTFIFKDSTDVNIVAGKKITFLPGFTVKSGVKLNARIQQTDINTTLPPPIQSLKKENTPTKGSYLEDSPYLKKSYDYSARDADPLEVEVPFEINVFPNPTNDFINISVKGILEDTSVIEFQNSIGQILLSEAISQNGVYSMNISNFPSGLYYIKVIHKYSTYQTKIIKL